MTVMDLSIHVCGRDYYGVTDCSGVRFTDCGGGENSVAFTVFSGVVMVSVSGISISDGVSNSASVKVPTSKITSVSVATFHVSLTATFLSCGFCSGCISLPKPPALPKVS